MRYVLLDNSADIILVSADNIPDLELYQYIYTGAIIVDTFTGEVISDV